MTSDLKSSLFERFAPALLVASVVLAFAVGVLWQKVQSLSGGAVRTSGIQGNVADGNRGSGSQAGVTVSFGSADQVDKLREDDHVRGDRKARILLIEYSDLECPFCKRFHPTAQRIVDEYKGQVAWVYRHFPLDQIHPKADKEAEATECAYELAGDEGFWKMTDKIFEVTPSNNGLNLDDLPKLASEAGLNQNKFKSCLDSGKYKAHVEADYQSGIKAGVTGTPGNILLDTKTGKTKLIPGALPFESFRTEIDNMLKES
jgi:protein-disulfide isomerase